MNSFKKIVALLLLALFSTSASAAITNTDLFAWAASAYPQYFSGTPKAGVYPPYNYQLYSSGNYLAVDNTSGVYVLGPVSGNQILNVGTLTSFTPLVTAWETKLCTSPQVYSNGGCATPAPTALPAGYVSEGGLTWMPVSSTPYTYAQATALCAGTINGQTGWRLPTLTELSGLTPPIAFGTYAAGGLYGSGAMNGQGWTLSDTWSSTPVSAGSHYTVSLHYGIVGLIVDTNSQYVTCVRSTGSTNATTPPAGYISQGGLTWMPPSSTALYTYAQATVLCAGTINGQTGWRLPTKDELSALYTAYPNDSSVLLGKGWTLGNTWSTTNDGLGTPYMVFLNNGSVFSTGFTDLYYVTCVR